MAVRRIALTAYRDVATSLTLPEEAPTLLDRLEGETCKL